MQPAILTFSYYCYVIFYKLIWPQISAFTWSRYKARGGCNRSTRDAYSFWAPDPTLVFLGVRVCLLSMLYSLYDLRDLSL